MMTTEHRTPSAVSRAALVAAGVSVALVVVAAVVGGSTAAAGAAVGGVLAVGVFAFGAFTVDAISRLMPSASLLFALMTYSLQVLVMAAVFVGLNRSGLLDDQLDREWLGGAIIVGVVAWMVVQVRMSMTARIPAFDAPAEGPASTATEAGAR